VEVARSSPWLPTLLVNDFARRLEGNRLHDRNGGELGRGAKLSLLLIEARGQCLFLVARRLRSALFVIRLTRVGQGSYCAWVVCIGTLIGRSTMSGSSCTVSVFPSLSVMSV
jgi:hypothetical protein